MSIFDWLKGEETPEPLYGVWYQSRAKGTEEWLVDPFQNGTAILSTSDIRLARAYAANSRVECDLSIVNYVVCEIGEDGRPCNCDGELWEIEAG